MRIERGFWGIVIFLLISGFFAFSLASGEKSTCPESIRRDVEQEALADAIKAFNARDYKRAKIGFEILSESTQNPEIARQALFGLSSVKLVLANTSDEYEDAISSWEKWSSQVNSWQGCEDPRMITPFLLRLQTSIKGAAGVEGRRAAKEIDFRVVLQTKEKEMQVLRSRLELREREIRRLRHQLESLEEIHRKYQEKKQEATQ